MNQPPVSSDTVLVAMCKRPLLHQGKQRLAAEIGAVSALAVAQGLLACALEDMQAWPGPLVLAPASACDRQWAQGLLPAAEIIPQPAGNLGQRLQQLDDQLRDRGHERILFIGTDAPILSTQHYGAAAAALARADIVLSTATDGGVTMMGSRCGWPSLEALPWSTERLGEALVGACRGQGQSVEFILPSYDVDVAADLRRLAGELRQDPRPARQRLLATMTKMTGLTKENILCTNR